MAGKGFVFMSYQPEKLEEMIDKAFPIINEMEFYNIHYWYRTGVYTPEVYERVVKMMVQSIRIVLKLEVWDAKDLADGWNGQLPDILSLDDYEVLDFLINYIWGWW